MARPACPPKRRLAEPVTIWERSIPSLGVSMANPQHVELLRKDVDAWNEWRAGNGHVIPDLAGADLTALNLVFANLTDSDLSDARLVMANLEGADLRWARLRRANLVGARLIGVDLDEADLSGADLSTAEDLTQGDIERARGDAETLLPAGLLRPAAWSRA